MLRISVLSATQYCILSCSKEQSRAVYKQTNYFLAAAKEGAEIRDRLGKSTHFSMRTISKFTRYGLVFVAGMSSLLSGAAIVHDIFKPDTSIPVLQAKKDESK
jgi:Domain of unknown function (DUF4516)